MVSSSTLDIPATGMVPRHVAIIMDGNGRWATERHLPRVAGHARGVGAVRNIVEACSVAGVEFLTLFAFSSENWRRPADEVSYLMTLFKQVMRREVSKLAKRGVRLRIVGDVAGFDAALQSKIREAEAITAANTGLQLTVAANYGGRWDILNAMRTMLQEHPHLRERPELIDEQHLTPYLALSYAPEPDLFIRTGGEQRVSNFAIWQLAYTELYFTDGYWPDFNAESLHKAFEWYRRRERRFGRTSAQLASAAGQAKSSNTDAGNKGKSRIKAYTEG